MSRRLDPAGGSGSPHRAAVYVVLCQSEDALFMMRAGTGYRDGEYGLPSGRVEPGEPFHEAAVREAFEELGVVVEPDHLTLAHVSERQTPTGNWLDFYFVCERWDDDATNAEPDKCDHIRWMPGQDPGVADCVHMALNAMKAGKPFSSYSGE